MTTSCLPQAFRFAVLAVVAFAALVVRAASPVAFDIPAQPAPAALKLFTKQSGAQVVYIQDELTSVTTQAVKGEYLPAEALTLLLAGTGFTAEPTGNGNFTVARASAAKPGSVEGSVQSESGKPVAGARVTLTGTKQVTVTDKRGRFTFEDVPAGSQILIITAEGMQNTKVTDVTVKAGQRLTLSAIEVPVAAVGAVQLEEYVVSAKKNEGVVELDPYEVSGSKQKPFTTANIDLTRTRDDLLPFQTFSVIEIEHSGASNLQEFLTSRLPQNFTADHPDEIGGISISSSGVNRIDLRGWGATETIYLLNGRRISSQYWGSGSDTQDATPNLQSIPLASIERIELLASAGSAIYGTNATGGVLNIITKKDFRGGNLMIHYDTPTDTHAPKRGFDLSYGMPLSNGMSLRLYASLSEFKPILSDSASDWSQRESNRKAGSR